MAKAEFYKSANEGRHTFCGVLNIELNSEDMDRIIFGKTATTNLLTGDMDVVVHIKESFNPKKEKKKEEKGKG